MANLHAIAIYPIKSLKGAYCASAMVCQTGLKNDRALLLTKSKGQMITARKLPILLKFSAHCDEEGIRIQSPSSESKYITWDSFDSIALPTKVWESEFFSYRAPASINEWFSNLLDTPIELRWLGVNSQRVISSHPAVPLSAADGYPFSLINLASFELLAKKCPSPLNIEQFRSNFHVTGCPAFDEDSWKVIQIGDVTFDVEGPYTRCGLITINPETTVYDPEKEPLRTLSTFRKTQSGNVHFAVQLIARNNGVINIGDSINIIERGPKITYEEY